MDNKDQISWINLYWARSKRFCTKYLSDPKSSFLESVVLCPDHLLCSRGLTDPFLVQVWSCNDHSRFFPPYCVNSRQHVSVIEATTRLPASLGPRRHNIDSTRLRATLVLYQAGTFPIRPGLILPLTHSRRLEHFILYQSNKVCEDFKCGFLSIWDQENTV